MEVWGQMNESQKNTFYSNKDKPGDWQGKIEGAGIERDSEWSATGLAVSATPFVGPLLGKMLEKPALDLLARKAAEWGKSKALPKGHVGPVMPTLPQRVMADTGKRLSGPQVIRTATEVASGLTYAETSMGAVDLAKGKVRDNHLTKMALGLKALISGEESEDADYLLEHTGHLAGFVAAGAATGPVSKTLGIQAPHSTGWTRTTSGKGPQATSSGEGIAKPIDLARDMMAVKEAIKKILPGGKKTSNTGVSQAASRVAKGGKSKAGEAPGSDTVSLIPEGSGGGGFKGDKVRHATDPRFIHPDALGGRAEARRN